MDLWNLPQTKSRRTLEFLLVKASSEACYGRMLSYLAFDCLTSSVEVVLHPWLVKCIVTCPREFASNVPAQAVALATRPCLDI